MSYIEIIQTCINRLRAIQVPVGLTEQIVIPLYNATSDLQAVVNGIAKEAQKESAPEMTEDKEDIENVGDESGVSETGIE